ncbi:MAG: hypothetical protein LBJ60_04845 [Tannerellaceae bacterium]|jgi:hypothetical protein|nr:hypothetical protein [Tannerellaceae bacterium]
MLSENYTTLVKVVIPVYKYFLSDLEKRSLRRAYSVLRDYPLIVVKPESLDVSDCLAAFPLITVQSFDDRFFTDISAYNRLMTSTCFYERFLDSKYILIYQLDAYVLRDELTEWCMYDFDYIGAPWLKKPVYNLPVISQIMRLCLKYDQYAKKPNKQTLYNKVGNGGFSLRKVERHYLATKKYEAEIERFLAQKRRHMYNEDVFWATRPEFYYPDALKALAFAYDKYPALSYKLTAGQLPFGCHAWYKRKMRRFWKDIINF